MTSPTTSSAATPGPGPSDGADAAESNRLRLFAIAVEGAAAASRRRGSSRAPRRRPAVAPQARMISPDDPAEDAAAPAAERAPILEARSVGKRYGATVALQDVSFSLRPGEICGLLGEN